MLYEQLKKRVEKKVLFYTFPLRRLAYKLHSQDISFDKKYVWIIFEPHVAVIGFPGVGIINCSTDPLFLISIVFEAFQDRLSHYGFCLHGRIWIFFIQLLRILHPFDLPIIGSVGGFENSVHRRHDHPDIDPSVRYLLLL